MRVPTTLPAASAAQRRGVGGARVEPWGVDGTRAESRGVDGVRRASPRGVGGDGRREPALQQPAGGRKGHNRVAPRHGLDPGDQLGGRGVLMIGVRTEENSMTQL